MTFLTHLVLGHQSDGLGSRCQRSSGRSHHSNDLCQRFGGRSCRFDDLCQRIGGRSHCSYDLCQGPMAKVVTLATSAKGPITKVVIPATSVGNPIAKDTVPIVEDIASVVVVNSLIIGAIVLAVLSLATSMAGPPILIVYLKNFTCHTKYLKIF